jgi:Ca-activated chloride channel family protein
VTFERPLLLLSLLLVPLAIGLYLLAERRRMRYAVRYTNVDVLAGVMRGRIWRQYVPLVLFLLALAALCVGMARPQRTTLVPKDRATVILVVDVSRSMESHDVKPSRIGAATAAVRLFLKKVPDRLQVGLIAFAGDPAVAAPPTTDHTLVRQALNTLEWYPSFGGTAIGDALAEAVRLGQEAVGGGNGNLASATAAPDSATHGLVSILFLSDGAQTRGLLQPLEGAKLAREACFPVYTIALGTPKGVIERGPFGGFPGSSNSQVIPVPPDPETLRAIARTTGGEFSEARTADSLEAAYKNLGSRLGRETGRSEITWLFVAIAAALLLLGTAVGAFVSPRLP